MTNSTMHEARHRKSGAFSDDAKEQKVKQPKFPMALKIFVKNLPQDKNVHNAMTEHLVTFGRVQDMHVYEAKIAGQRFKQMLAVFSSEDEAQQATKLTGTVVGGRHIIVSTHRQYAQSTSKTVVVFNVSVDTDEEDLWQFFESCGTIRFIHIERLLNAQSHRAEIHFDSVESAQKALKKSGTELKGSTVSVTCLSEEPAKEFPVYVSGLPSDIQKEDLAEFFDGCGSIKRIKIQKSKQDEKVDATVFFKDFESSENGLACDGKEISGHVVKVTQRESAIAEKSQFKYMNPLYIVGIARDTKDIEIFLHFQDCGFMNDVKFVASKSGCLKKAIIDFKDAESINNALALDDLELHGHTLIISKTPDVLSGEYPATKSSKRKFKQISSSGVEVSNLESDAELEVESVQTEQKKKKKKKKNHIQNNDMSHSVISESLSSSVIEQSESKKKKKKDRKLTDDLSNGAVGETLSSSLAEQSESKKRKKRDRKLTDDLSNGAVGETLSSSFAEQSESKKKKKKDRRQNDDLSVSVVDESLSSSVIDESERKKKKKTK